MAYRHNDALHKHRKREKKFRRLTFFVVLVVSLFTLGISIDWLVGKYYGRETVVSSVSTATVQSATINVFRTPFFQFQADDSWVEVPESSTENKFVYKSLNGPLIEHQLTFYVNEAAPAKMAATRLLPVEIVNGRFNKTAEIKEHCNTVLPEPKRLGVGIVSLEDVTFKCALDSNVYRVFVGAVGGTNEISIVRPNGETGVYTIVYDDLRYLPNANQIKTIIETLQVR